MIYLIIYLIIVSIVMSICIFSMGYDYSQGNYNHMSIEDMLIMSVLWPFWLVAIPLLILYKIIFAVGVYVGSKNKK